MYNKVKENLKQSMKDKDTSLKTFYKNFKNQIDTYVKENQISDIIDEVVFTVVRKQVKDNLKAIVEYEKFERKDLAKKLLKENEIYKLFSAPVKSVEETNTLINNQFVGLDVFDDFNVNKTRGMIMKNLSEYKKELDWDYVVAEVGKKLNELVVV